MPVNVRRGTDGLQNQQTQTVNHDTLCKCLFYVWRSSSPSVFTGYVCFSNNYQIRILESLTVCALLRKNIKTEKRNSERINLIISKPGLKVFIELKMRACSLKSAYN